MPIYDRADGTNYEIGAVWERNDGVNHEIASVYDRTDGVNHLVYTAFDGVLYNAGDQCTNATGGWTNNAGGTTADCVRTITYATSYMQLSVTNYNDWDSFIYATVTTANSINMDNFSTLHIQWAYDCDKSGSDEYPYVEFVVGSISAKPLQPGTSITSANDFAKTTTEINISGLTGTYKPAFKVFSLYSDTNLRVRIYKVWLT